MSNTKKTQRALMSSAIAILLCFAMLIGTTFAWFTDSKSTTVNSIDSGNLHVALLDQNGDPVTDRALNWVTADNRAQDKILWEPGCTYNLETVTIKNTGALALQYKVEISGILSKDQFLNSAIDWTITVGGETVDITSFQGHLLPGESTELTVSGHMKELAGNEYQDKSIEGAAIKVIATQYTYENDSYSDQYDASAEYAANTVTIDGVDFYVLKTEGTKTLLLAKNTVGTANFDSDSWSCTWEESDVRAYLNGEWLNQYPTLAATAANTTIYTAKMMAEGNTEVEFVETTDKVFLLSEADVFGTTTHMGNRTSVTADDSRYYSTGSQLAAPDGSWFLGDGDGNKLSTAWWLRTPWGECYIGVVNNENLDGLLSGQGANYYSLGLRPALWIDTFETSLAENGAVSVTENRNVTDAVVMQTPNATITTSSEEGVVLTSSSGPKAGVIAFAPQSLEDSFFEENSVFNVTLDEGVTISAASKGNSGIVLGNAASYDANGVEYTGYVPAAEKEANNVITYRASNKTLNVTGGTFESYSGEGNGAICVTNMDNSTVNISNATFILQYSSGSKYASLVSLDTRGERTQQGYYFADISVKNTKVTLTNCTFVDRDGNVIEDITGFGSDDLGRLFYGFGGTSGNTLVINGNTVIG